MFDTSSASTGVSVATGGGSLGGGVFAGLVVVFLVALAAALCHRFGMWTRAVAWATSTREEKVSLTRARGHYNANGYLIHSDSDIQLTNTGSFKRFEPVDFFPVSPPPAANIGPIPPQPLRPAPPRPPPPIRTPSFPVPPIAVKSPSPTVETQASDTVIPIQLSSQSEKSVPVNNNQKTVVRQTLSFDMEEEANVGGGVGPLLQRAMSCDSVCSDTSVVLGDLQESNITGYLCVGVEYDSESYDLVVSVVEAKDLAGPDPDHPDLDTYVRVFLLPDKLANLQTRVYRHSSCPSYKEKFLLGVEPSELPRRALGFHVYSSGRHTNTLIGEAELKLTHVTNNATTWLTLTDQEQRGAELGEVMFSLSYLPTAERLTVVVVKARNLRFSGERPSGDPFVKVYLLHHGKKVHKKKTSTKRDERSPIFNEAMIFSVPAHTLQTIQLRLTVAESFEGAPRAYALGHVIIGSQANGKALSHWNQMLSSLRKPIAMWHPIRK